MLMIHFSSTRQWLVVALAACLVIALGGRVVQAQTNHGDFLGSGAGEVDFIGVTEASGPGDPASMFGSPTRVGNELVFIPQNFASQAVGGSTDTTSGDLDMSIEAPSGYFITKIEIAEAGDYQLVGFSSGGTTEASVEGNLTVNGGGGTFLSQLTTTPASPFSLPADSGGGFQGLLELEFTGQPLTNVVLSYEALLETASESSSIAFIQRKGIVVRVYTAVPEPATATLLVGIAGAGLIRRPRRRR